MNIVANIAFLRKVEYYRPGEVAMTLEVLLAREKCELEYESVEEKKIRANQKGERITSESGKWWCRTVHPPAMSLRTSAGWSVNDHISVKAKSSKEESRKHLVEFLRGKTVFLFNNGVQVKEISVPQDLE